MSITLRWLRLELKDVPVSLFHSRRWLWRRCDGGGIDMIPPHFTTATWIRWQLPAGSVSCLLNTNLGSRRVASCTPIFKWKDVRALAVGNQCRPLCGWVLCIHYGCCWTALAPHGLFKHDRPARCVCVCVWRMCVCVCVCVCAERESRQMSIDNASIHQL